MHRQTQSLCFFCVLVATAAASAAAPAQFTVLHNFAGGAGDGSYPYGSLIQSGSTLYGMTNLGGSSGAGTIFQIRTDGTGFTRLHSFAGGTGDGANPWGSLILSGSALYGMTYAGGSSNRGTIFRLVVPEPSALALAAVAMFGLLQHWRRRNP
jgi:uncharacterized repeat protein (TIGR03803 family)